MLVMFPLIILLGCATEGTDSPVHRIGQIVEMSIGNLNWYEGMERKNQTYEVVEMITSKEKACEDLTNLLNVSLHLRRARSENPPATTLRSMSAEFMSKMTALKTYMEFFEDEESFHSPCILPGFEDFAVNGSCMDEASPPLGCLSCVTYTIPSFRTHNGSGCAWLYQDYQDIQVHLLALKANGSTSITPVSLSSLPSTQTTTTLGAIGRQVSISECGSVSSYPENEARQLLLLLNVSLSDDLSVLQEGKIFLPDINTTLTNLQRQWEPLSSHKHRKKRNMGMKTKKNHEVKRQVLTNSSSCELNSNDDPSFLLDKLEQMLDLWGKKFTNRERLLSVSCYLTKISSRTNEETIDKGLDERTRNASIAQKIRDTLASTAEFQRDIENLEIGTEEARQNVSETLYNNLEFVYVCPNAYRDLPLETIQNATQQTTTPSQESTIQASDASVTVSPMPSSTDTSQADTSFVNESSMLPPLNNSDHTTQASSVSVSVSSTSSLADETQTITTSVSESSTLTPQLNNSNNPTQISDALTSVTSSSSSSDVIPTVITSVNESSTPPTTHIRNTTMQTSNVTRTVSSSPSSHGIPNVTETVTSPRPLQDISISNCTSVSSFSRPEAVQMLYVLNSTYSHDLTNLQEGKVLINDMSQIINHLQGLWEPLTNQEQRRRRFAINREIRETTSIGISLSPECDLETTEDSRLLVEQLGESINFWGEKLTDVERSSSAACSLSKMSFSTENETAEEGEEDRSRDAYIAQRLRDIAASTYTLEEKADDLIVETQEAIFNVTQALTNESDSVHVCINAHSPIQRNDSNNDTTTPQQVSFINNTTPTATVSTHVSNANLSTNISQSTEITSTSFQQNPTQSSTTSQQITSTQSSTENRQNITPPAITSTHLSNTSLPTDASQNTETTRISPQQSSVQVPSSTEQVSPLSSSTDTTQNTQVSRTPGTSRSILISNCSSVSSFPEEEARQYLLQLNTTYSNDIFALQEGQLFIPDIQLILNNLASSWEPLNNKRKRKRRKRGESERRAFWRRAISSNSDCDINFNDDPRFLTEQLEVKFNLWGEKLADAERIFTVKCYVTRVSAITNQETLELGLAGRSRDAYIAQKMRGIVAATPALGGQVDALKMRTEEAKHNVTEALDRNLDFVYTCVYT